MTRTIDEQARDVFDATPSRHPGGRKPDWELQPEHIREIFRGFAREGRTSA